MLKVRFETITLRVPVIDNSGEHDAKMDEGTYAAMHEALAVLQPSLTGQGSMLARAGLFAATENGWPPGRVIFAEGGRLPQVDLSTTFARPESPVSQVDPPIDTTVRDSEMRGSEREMTLDELRERPEKTRAPPRPRANSWRHNQ